MAVEEAKYSVVRRDGAFELRDYAPQILAETVVAGAFEQAGNDAFGGSFATSPATTAHGTRWR